MPMPQVPERPAAPERTAVDVLADAAIAMPWRPDEIARLLVGWAREVVDGEVTVQSLPAPAPDVSLMFADQRFLVVHRRLGEPDVTDLERRVLAALATMATASLHAARRTERLRHRADTDDLTGLWHHSSFLEMFESAMETRSRENVGVLFLDIDRFKQLNEQLGHLDADEVLRTVADRIRRCTALTDGSIVGRMGGDEFAVVLRRLENRDHLDRIVRDLHEAVSAPMPVKDVMLSVDVSIGSEYSRRSVDDPNVLLRAAERQMRHNKRARPDALPPRWYDERTVLREMLDQGRVAIALQPIVELPDRAVIGFEALVRGRHLEVGTVSPLVLVGSASKLRMLDELTEVVIDQSLAAVGEAAARLGRELTLSVNVEFDQLRTDSRLLESLPGRVAGRPVRLVLEMSERGVARWTTSQRAVAEWLREQGVGLAVDDFGTGYSALGLLNSWPWHWVKIDRSLVAERGGEAGRTVLSHVARMLDDLDLTAVVEGVETTDELAHAVEIGVTLAQGTYFSPPLSPDAVLDSLTT